MFQRKNEKIRPMHERLFEHRKMNRVVDWVPASLEDNEAYQQMEAEGAPLPQNVKRMQGNPGCYVHLRMIGNPEETKELLMFEMQESLFETQAFLQECMGTVAKELRSIASAASFFHILGMLSLIAGIIAGLLLAFG